MLNKNVYLQGRASTRNNKASCWFYVRALQQFIRNGKWVYMWARRARRRILFPHCRYGGLTGKQCKMVDGKKRGKHVRLRAKGMNTETERGSHMQTTGPDTARPTCVALHRWISIDARIRQHRWLSFFKWKFAGRSELILWDAPEERKRFALSTRYTLYYPIFDRADWIGSLFFKSSRWSFHIIALTCSMACLTSLNVSSLYIAIYRIYMFPLSTYQRCTCLKYCKCCKDRKFNQINVCMCAYVCVLSAFYLIRAPILMSTRL